MTEGELQQHVLQWDRVDPTDDPNAQRYLPLLERLAWFGETEWTRYLPAEHPNHFPRYLARLAQWIGNTQDESSRQLLLRYAARIAFFSQDDFVALYRAAFDGPITRWIIDQCGLRFEDATFQAELAKHLHRRTWFCPVTDSMAIGEFYHCNHLTGVSHRPCIATQAMLAKTKSVGRQDTLVEELRAYAASPNPRSGAESLLRLVLLEDFVGSGTQSLSAVEWAVTHLERPVLFVPLVICPSGLASFRALAAKYPDALTIAPVIEISANELLGPKRAAEGDWLHAAALETFARDTFARVGEGRAPSKKHAPYGPFGYEDTGCSICTYSNTPNNTLPLVHHEPADGSWHALFPRAARI